ncbi:hypothetical protein AB9F35_34520, partial [Rhizobium leguminosarum]
KAAADEVKLEEMLNGIGVKIVYIYFREHILANTEPSLKILCHIFGHEDRAEAVASFWKEQMARVTDIHEVLGVLALAPVGAGDDDD